MAVCLKQGSASGVRTEATLSNHKPDQSHTTDPKGCVRLAIFSPSAAHASTPALLFSVGSFSFKRSRQTIFIHKMSTLPFIHTKVLSLNNDGLALRNAWTAIQILKCLAYIHVCTKALSLFAPDPTISNEVLQAHLLDSWPLRKPASLSRLKNIAEVCRLLYDWALSKDLVRLIRQLTVMAFLPYDYLEIKAHSVRSFLNSMTLGLDYLVLVTSLCMAKEMQNSQRGLLMSLLRCQKKFIDISAACDQLAPSQTLYLPTIEQSATHFKYVVILPCGQRWAFYELYRHNHKVRSSMCFDPGGHLPFEVIRILGSH